MYGCSPKKLAEILGKPMDQAEELYDSFWELNKPIKELNDALVAAYTRNSGWIYGLDRRRLYVRSKRVLLNTLLQHAAAMVFKRWMVLCNEYIDDISFDNEIAQVIAYHDELEFECKISNEFGISATADEFTRLALDAGKYFNVKVPTPAEAKIGDNWAEVH